MESDKSFEQQQEEVVDDVDLNDDELEELESALKEYKEMVKSRQNLMDYMSDLKKELTNPSPPSEPAPAPVKKEKKPKVNKFDVERYKQSLQQKTHTDKILEAVYKDQQPPWMRKSEPSTALAFPSSRSFNSSIYLEGGVDDEDSFNNSNVNLIKGRGN